MTTSADLQAYAATLFGLQLVTLDNVTTSICYQVEGDAVTVSIDSYIESGVWSYDTDYDDCSVEVLTVGNKVVMTKAEARGHYKHHLQLGFKA